MGVGKNVCLTVLLFDGLSVHTFVCKYIVVCVCFCPSFCLPIRILSMCRPSVCPSVRPPVRIFLCDIVCYSIGLYVFFPFVQPGRVAQSVGHPTRKSGVRGSIPGLATYFRFSVRFFKKGSCQLLAKVCARSTG